MNYRIFLQFRAALLFAYALEIIINLEMWSIDILLYLSTESFRKCARRHEAHRHQGHAACGIHSHSGDRGHT